MAITISNAVSGITNYQDIFPHYTAATRITRIDGAGPFSDGIYDLSYYRGALFTLRCSNLSNDGGAAARTFNCRVDHSPDGHIWARLYSDAVSTTQSFTEVAAGATTTQFFEVANVGRYVRVTVTLSGILDAAAPGIDPHILATVQMTAKK